ncbi:glycine cleavage system protein H [Anaerosporomusa subterranea]|uniref:Glycine cleavage system H protein n=1 Tax=Anaerosporomusa subterranea TaxID=1794912 RepID=A0A154BMQ1_ANASB|nr:glycine cleavage system protein GcvH [Anaerosporomusa subterranea]KYZ75181.1 glycine cleavage system protein H [Anaerosporomusa subterranea]
MKIVEDLRYTKDHEWVRIEGTQAIVGITDYAQGELGDVVFIELPEIGKKAKAHTTVTTIESVKAVSDIFAPLSGTIIKVNDQLNDNPELVNQQPYDEGWIFVIELENLVEVGQLLDAAQYGELVGKH